MGSFFLFSPHKILPLWNTFYMDTTDQIISELSDLNKQLTEELYLWSMRGKYPLKSPETILDISRIIHEKTYLLTYVCCESTINDSTEIKTESANDIKEKATEIEIPIEIVFENEVTNIKNEVEELEKVEEIDLIEQTPSQTSSIVFEIETPELEIENTESVLTQTENLELTETTIEINKTIETPKIATNYYEPVAVKEIPLADQLRNTSLQNINSAIGISEKFLFIHELFKGDTERYMLEISKLNDFYNNDVAHSYFQKITKDLNWDEKSHAFLELKKLIDRKYQKN